MGLTALAKLMVLFNLGMLFMQFGDMPPDTDEDPFLRATTPPAAFLLFNEDFSSMDINRLMTWINPNRGLVKNGVLLTKEEAQTMFGEGSHVSEAGRLDGINIFFNYGEYVSGNMFQADCWVEYLLTSGGTQNSFRFHNIFVFEIIDSGWYLIQSEYIPTEVPLAREGGILDPSSEVPPEFQRFVVPFSESSQGRLSLWPLLLGTNFASDTELMPISGLTPGGRQWTLEQAVNLRKPTVLVFFWTHSLYVGTDEEINAQMGLLEDLYDTFGYEDLFIFGVTDGSEDVVGWLHDSGYDSFAILKDEGSAIHLALNVNILPYIVVLDSMGTVVGISSVFHETSLDLIEDRIREAVARSVT